MAKKSTKGKRTTSSRKSSRFTAKQQAQFIGILRERAEAKLEAEE